MHSQLGDEHTVRTLCGFRALLMVVDSCSGITFLVIFPYNTYIVQPDAKTAFNCCNLGCVCWHCICWVLFITKLLSERCYMWYTPLLALHLWKCSTFGSRFQSTTDSWQTFQWRHWCLHASVTAWPCSWCLVWCSQMVCPWHAVQRCCMRMVSIQLMPLLFLLSVSHERVSQKVRHEPEQVSPSEPQAHARHTENQQADA